MTCESAELFFEPIEILDSLSDGYKAEMSNEQLAFLCGLIRRYKPEKIVEIGVAAGGTTVVVLNCLSMLGLDVRMYSIDLSGEYYRDKSKKTGYLIEECKSGLKKNWEHTLYTGKVAVEYLETIGKGIDLLILDTVHRLPGEILDFLACYPFLKKGSVVVLHDIAVNHYGSNAQAFATKLLFDTVSAEKYMGICDDNVFPNIGAFVINDDTEQSIDDIFSALTITWNYLPENQELFLYRTFYEKYYPIKNIRIFDIAVQLNRRTVDKNVWMKEEFIREIVKEVLGWNGIIKGKRIYIYGCGYFGRKLSDLLGQTGGIELAGYIISDGQKKTETKFPVYYLSEISLTKDQDVIFVGVRPALQEEICAELQSKGFTDYIMPSEKMFRVI